MSSLTDRVRGRALELGFDLVGFAPAQPSDYEAFYHLWVEKGYAGEMGYLVRPDALARRADPRRILPEARSVIVVGLNHYARDLPEEIRHDPSRGLIARYAWGNDYHAVMVPRLQELVSYIEAETGRQVACKVYVDTGPVLEREVAVRAGLGFFGRNTMMISPTMGSYLFLGEILVDLELEYDEPDTRGTCGRCTRCLIACPTDAFVEPCVIDARRCISYLTIELKGPIPRGLRPLMGNWIFGCDVCQEVCPWVHRYSCPTGAPAFRPWLRDAAPELLPLMEMTDEVFRARFRDSPVRRSRRRGFLRNVAVALGNWGDPMAVPALSQALEDHEPLIRGHAAWALGRIGGQEARRALESTREAENDTWVRREICVALDWI